ncbi:MAG: adenylyl-sulfate kinase [Bryobacterales bacterium]|nr:adenylyl-sulfate kinase [Bryobacterales bacterium]
MRGALARFEFEADDEVLLRDPQNIRIAAYRPGEGLSLIEMPAHPDFTGLRRGPGELPPHQALVTDGFITRDMEEVLQDGSTILHVLQFGAVDHYARVRAALAVVDAARVNVLPLSAADHEVVKEAVHAYGATEILPLPGNGDYSPKVAAIVEEAIPPRSRQGFCVFFTGLPSSGKSTVANQLAVLLKERGRAVSMLDGDVVRMQLSKGLGFSREDRDTNIRRIGFVAGEIVRHHGVAICAAVSPYQESRDAARRMVGENFVLVYVATPAEICEQRDVKGFYAKARSGGMQGMTGVDDPYEPPTNAEVTLQTSGVTPEENARVVLRHLHAAGWLSGDTI